MACTPSAKDRETALEELAASPAQVAQLQGLVDSGRLTDKLACFFYIFIPKQFFRIALKFYISGFQNIPSIGNRKSHFSILFN